MPAYIQNVNGDVHLDTWRMIVQNNTRRKNNVRILIGDEIHKIDGFTVVSFLRYLKECERVKTWASFHSSYVASVASSYCKRCGGSGVVSWTERATNSKKDKDKLIFIPSDERVRISVTVDASKLSYVQRLPKVPSGFFICEICFGLGISTHPVPKKYRKVMIKRIRKYNNDQM